MRKVKFSPGSTDVCFNEIRCNYFSVLQALSKQVMLHSELVAHKEKKIPSL